MSVWIIGVVGVAVAYLLGSLPSGYLAGRWLKGIDLRQVGSGSTGATNVLRTLGKGPAAVVISVDLLKGVAAVVFTRWLYAQPFAGAAASWTDWAVCVAGLAVVVGHSRSVWLGFAGGKSAATGLGVLLAMSWAVGLGAAAVFVACVAAFRIVSLGSMLGAVSAVVLVCALPEPLAYRLLVFAGAAFVIVRHRANIARLLAGTEPRVGQPSPTRS